MEKEQRGCKVGKEDKEDSVSGRCLVEPDSPWGILSHTMQTKVTDKGRRTTPRALEGPTLVLLQARPKASRSDRSSAARRGASEQESPRPSRRPRRSPAPDTPPPPSFHLLPSDGVRPPIARFARFGVVVARHSSGPGPAARSLRPRCVFVGELPSLRRDT